MFSANVAEKRAGGTGMQDKVRGPSLTGGRSEAEKESALASLWVEAYDPWDVQARTRGRGEASKKRAPHHRSLR